MFNTGYECLHAISIGKMTEISNHTFTSRWEKNRNTTNANYSEDS